ncbi:F-box domain containing protein [Pandoravirus neocaledonia]|uniref:F-box domain containing protein n=1 Tax=Pandoravirus neocaledonia TaxID=2107708 RepID=A0A2U7UD45_9VIRU|nr:F-box domain containing protein [Pandoravirus neocaledonia]AVK76322.1 F-box domain containing protein [Pandoravirus neocaledonia]
MDPMLPAELMCVVFEHLPLPWWVVAARVCRWWRACIQTAWRSHRGLVACVPYPHLNDTLDTAVRCGYVGAAVWAAEIVGANLHDTAFTAAWMGFGQTRSWGEAAIEAARAGRHNVILWMGRHARSLQESPVVEVVALYGHADCLGKLLARLPFRIMREGWRHRIVACAIASGNAECVDMVLADRRFDVGLPAAFLAAIALPRCVEPVLSRSRASKYAAHSVRWLAAHNPVPPQSVASQAHRRDHAVGAQGGVGELPAVPISDDTRIVPWPPMRSLTAHDFLPGGALADYSASTVWSRHAMRYLLRPLVLEGGCGETLCRCIDMRLKPRPKLRLLPRAQQDDALVRPLP